jgi:hypothetical protein
MYSRRDDALEMSASALDNCDVHTLLLLLLLIVFSITLELYGSSSRHYCDKAHPKWIAAVRVVTVTCHSVLPLRSRGAHGITRRCSIFSVSDSCCEVFNAERELDHTEEESKIRISSRDNYYLLLALGWSARRHIFGAKRCGPKIADVDNDYERYNSLLWYWILGHPTGQSDVFYRYVL